MIQWLSDYNYDYALATIPIQLVLMLFYCARRNLPIRQSRSFLLVMVSNLIMTISDIAACEMDAAWDSFPLWSVYGINILYFVAFICRGWTLFDYTAEVCSTFKITGRLGQILSAVPAIAMLVMIFSSPWTGAIFRIAPPDGYSSGPLYQALYYCTWFYILFSIFTVFLCWKHASLRIKVGLLGFNVILLMGIILRKEFSSVLVTSYFSLLAILVIYLTAQNPDLYRERQTRLFNRDAFHVICQEYVSKGISFHCIVISTHNYDSARAIYGHSQLRRCMQLIGRWMVAHFNGYYVFYFGNGDFVLLRRGTFEENRDQAVQIINERFEYSWIDIGTEVSLSMSVMVLPYEVIPKDILQIEDLIRYSFEQSYLENNKGNVIVREEMVQSLQRQEEVETALRRAIDEHRLEAYFQPIYSTRYDRIVGAEALARLNDPKLGFIPPVEFIEVAEQTGDIMDVGREIFLRVCEFAEKTPLQDLDLEFINVNLSPAQCMNEQLAFELSQIASEHHVPMDKLDFEITETSISDYTMIKKQMLRLQELGAELSLDDFGAGTSNLNSLMQLPIHIVKIDMEVVRSYFRGETRVLPDLIQLFQNANMKIVAEGVETEEMKDVLSQMGCDYLQGYYFSKPLPPSEFLEYLAD